MVEVTQHKNFRFTWMEFSGSLGDLGLFLPLVVGMTVSCGLDMGVILVWAGLMNILTGWLFRQPIPVQPMKAIAAVVITEGLTQHELVASGLLIGILLLIVSGIIDQINRFVPKVIVRGIQLGIGLKLATKGAQWMTSLPFVGWDGILTGIIVIILLFILLNKNQPALLYIFLIGFLLQYFKNPEIYSAITMTPPHFYWHWPNVSAWSAAFWKGALPQLPLTILNSVIALCALSAQYFPGQGAAPKKVALSVGLMNLFCVPLGGIPMCHGSGGLAAQYRFGARTGGSVIMLGGLKVIAGLLFGGALLGLLQSYPLAILGPMLIFAGIALARTAKDVVGQREDLTVILVMAAFIVGVNTFVGFLAGCGLVLVYRLKRQKTTSGEKR